MQYHWLISNTIDFKYHWTQSIIPLVSCHFINLDFLPPHILIKALAFLCLCNPLVFTFPIFFYTSNSNITLFYKLINIFNELLKALDFWYLHSYYHHVYHLSLKTLFIETNSSWLIYESINTQKIKTCMVFNLANNILLYFFFFFLIIDLYFLIPAVII